MSNKKIIVAYENGKAAKGKLKFEVVSAIKKQKNNAIRFAMVFFVFSAILFFKNAANGNSLVNEMLSGNMKSSKEETNVNDVIEKRTQAENLLSSVNIQTITKDSLFTGSGTIIQINENEMLILTARHVLLDDTSVTYVVRFADNSETVAEKKYLSSNYDWGVLSIPIDNVPISVQSTCKAAILSTNKASVGDTVYNVRSHYIEGVSVYSGKITNTRQFNIRETIYTTGIFLETDYNVLEGASGGGLFNEDGQLIGVSSQTSTDDESSLFCLVNDIMDWLDSK